MIRMGRRYFLCLPLTKQTAALPPPLYRCQKKHQMAPVEALNLLHGPVDMHAPATSSALLLKVLPKPLSVRYPG
jgi:hypothetical protein